MFMYETNQSPSGRTVLYSNGTRPIVPTSVFPVNFRSDRGKLPLEFAGKNLLHNKNATLALTLTMMPLLLLRPVAAGHDDKTRTISSCPISGWHEQIVEIVHTADNSLVRSDRCHHLAEPPLPLPPYTQSLAYHRHTGPSE